MNDIASIIKKITAGLSFYIVYMRAIDLGFNILQFPWLFLVSNSLSSLYSKQKNLGSKL